jgi:hypothetical protein
LQLAAAMTSRGQETIGILELVMVRISLGRIIPDHFGNDLSLAKGRTVMHSDDANKIVCILDNDWLEAFSFTDGGGHALDNSGLIAVDRQSVDASLGDNDELQKVDGVCTFAQDHPLRSALAAILEEGLHILEIIGRNVGRQNLGLFERLAVAGKDVTDLALCDSNEWHHVNNVLDRHQPVQTAAQHFGLETCFAVKSDQPRLDRTTSKPFFHQPNTVVGNEANSHEKEQQYGSDPNDTKSR